VERTRVLVHVVDGSAADPERDFGIIRDELDAHDPALLRKPMLVVLNKLDLPSAAEHWPSFAAARAADDLGVVAVAAARGDGLDELRSALAALLPPVGELDAAPDATGVVVHRIDAMGDGFLVEPENGAFRVRGRRIERIAAQTDFDNEESAERFQRELARMGIDQELRRAGVAAGDTVRIGGTELEWEAQPWDDR
jgi:GTP-binding protein